MHIAQVGARQAAENTLWVTDLQRIFPAHFGSILRSVTVSHLACAVQNGLASVTTPGLAARHTQEFFNMFNHISAVALTAAALAACSVDNSNPEDIASLEHEVVSCSVGGLEWKPFVALFAYDAA